jgi:hypothetical protein
MNLVAAAVPSSETREDSAARVLADAENVVVGILFDDIVRGLVRPPAALVRQPEPGDAPRSEWMGAAPITTGRQRSTTPWARSPPGA